MELTIDELDKLLSIRRRYVNMPKKFFPDIANFKTLMLLIHELSNIHHVERKMVMSRYQQVLQAKQLSDETRTPANFFKYHGTLAEFKRFWVDLHKELFTSSMKADLAAVFATEPRLASIKVGYHIRSTGKESKKELLALMAAEHPVARITFTDGNVIEMRSFDEDEVQRVQEIYVNKMGKILSFAM